MRHSRLAPALLVCSLFMAAFANAQDAPAPGPTKSEPPIAHDSRDAAYVRARAAYDKGDWSGVLAAVPAVLEGTERDQRFFQANLMAAAASANTGRPEDSLGFADRYLAEMVTSPALGDSRDADSLQKIYGWRIRALLTLGRGAEAGSAATKYLQEFPGAAPSSVAQQAIAASHFHGKAIVDPSYEGKYRTDSRFSAEVLRLEKAIPLAINQLRLRLADPEFSVPPFIIRIVDGEGRPLKGHMSTIVVRLGEQSIPVIFVQAESLVSRVVGESLLTHEIAHVCRLMTKGVRPGPRWVEEGIAVWAADADGDAVLGLRAFFPGSLEDANPLLSALEGERQAEAVPEEWVHSLGGLLFWDLEKRKGGDSARALARRLLSGADWRKSITEADGRTLGAALMDLKSRGPALLAAEIPELARVEAIVVLMKAQRYREALEALDSLLKEHPRSREGPRAEFYRAFALYGLKRNAESARAFEKLIEEHPESPIAPEAAYWRICLANRAWDFARVVREGEAYLRDYVWAEARFVEAARTLVKDAREALDAMRKPTPPGPK